MAYAKATSAGQIGALAHNGIDSVCTSPPYADSVVRALPSGQIGPLGIRMDDETAPPDYGDTAGQIGNQAGETYASAMYAVLRECHRVVKPGGCLVLVTGNYVRDGKIVDLAADTIRLAEAAGWIGVERWEHRKAQVSFWRRLHAKQAAEKGIDPATVTVTSEDVLVFVRDYQGWPFEELEPTTVAPADLSTRGRDEPAASGLRLFPEDAAEMVAG